jgi:hypothetical protein
MMTTPEGAVLYHRSNVAHHVKTRKTSKSRSSAFSVELLLFDFSSCRFNGEVLSPVSRSPGLVFKATPVTCKVAY